MADYNNNSRLPLLAEKRLLALAALEVVHRHDVLRMTELNSHVLELTSELAIVRNERDEIQAEFDRRGIMQGADPRTYRPVRPVGWGDPPTNRPVGAVGVQGNEDWVVDDQEFAAGIENRHQADDIFALAMAVQQITTRMTEAISRIDELNDKLADLTSERDQMRAYLNGDGWGRFRLLPRDWWNARQARERG